MFDSAFRLGYSACLAQLSARLAEPPPTRVQLLTGPRQVGKTTLLLTLADQLGARATYAALDAPESTLPGFWERTWATAEALAHTHGRATLLLDEVQHLPDWATRLKGQWDRVVRKKLRLHVVATGSSALALGAGSRESLAGRFERLAIGHWTAAEIAAGFGLSQKAAVREVLFAGTYPGAIGLRRNRDRQQAYVRDAIVEPAIGRDLLATGQVRRPALLRQLLAVAAASPAQIVSLQKLQGTLQDPGALETLAHYLALLEDACLVAPLQKHAVRPERRRAAPPKLVTLSNAILATLDPRGAPSERTDEARFGAWVENACLAHAWTSGQAVRYWREEPDEVDAITSGSWGAWAIEVKTGDVRASDLRALLEFCRRFPEHRPLLVSTARGLAAAERAGIAGVTYERFLLEGPPVA